MSLPANQEKSVPKKKRVDTVSKPDSKLAWKYAAGGLIILYCIVDFLFALAGIPFFDPPQGGITVKVIDVAAKGHVIAAIVGLFGGYVALVTYYLSYHQKQYFQNLQIANADDIADENRIQQNEWELNKNLQINEHFRARLVQEEDIASKSRASQDLAETEKLKVQRDHFDRQRKQEEAQSNYDAIATEYDALSKDFVADEELARINAAIGLAAIAKKADPRKEIKLKEDESVEKTNEFFPWYERIAMQLASALIIYPESRARDQVRNSIRDIARFDVGPGVQPLLTFLINTLADANRTAYRTFVDTVAEGMACEKPLHLRTFARAVTIFQQPFANARMLNNLRKQGDYTLAYRAQRDKRRLTPRMMTPGDPDSNFLDRLRTISKQLEDTRDAISDCVSLEVRTIAVKDIQRDPHLWTSDFEEESFVEWLRATLEMYEEVPELELQGCMLQGANLILAELSRANLHTADLSGAKLGGAMLNCAILEQTNLLNTMFSDAHLHLASFVGANIRRSQFFGANAQGADFSYTSLKSSSFYQTQLTGARFQRASITNGVFLNTILAGASFVESEMQGTLLQGANLQGADLTRAKLQGSFLAAAVMRGATLHLTMLQSAQLADAKLNDAKISSACFGTQDGTELAKGLVWKDADVYYYNFNSTFQPEKSDVRNTELIKFLRNYFPDGGPAEGEHWPDGLLHEEDY